LRGKKEENEHRWAFTEPLSTRLKFGTERRRVTQMQIDEMRASAAAARGAMLNALLVKS